MNCPFKLIFCFYRRVVEPIFVRFRKDDDRSGRSWSSYQHGDNPSLRVGCGPPAGGPEAQATLVSGVEKHHRMLQVQPTHESHTRCANKNTVTLVSTTTETGSSNFSIYFKQVRHCCMVEHVILCVLQELELSRRRGKKADALL